MTVTVKKISDREFSISITTAPDSVGDGFVPPHASRDPGPGFVSSKIAYSPHELQRRLAEIGLSDESISRCMADLAAKGSWIENF